MQMVVAVLGVQLAQLLAENGVEFVRRVVDVHRVRQALLLDQAVQHASGRRDTAARGDEQRLNRRGVRQVEIALGQAHRNKVADFEIAHDVVGQPTAVDLLHGDGEAAVVPLRRRRDRVGAGVVPAVHRDAHAYVLAGAVQPPVGAGLQGDGAAVLGLVPHVHHPRVHTVGGPQRVHQLHVMGGTQREGEHVGDRRQPVQPAFPRFRVLRLGHGLGSCIHSLLCCLCTDVHVASGWRGLGRGQFCANVAQCCEG